MSGQEKAKVVIKLGQLNKIDDLKVIVENLEEDELQEICESCLKENDINTFLHYLLKGFISTAESKEKRFNVISFVLKLLNREEMQMKATINLVTRICVDLESYTNDQIVAFVESCLDSIRQKDSQTVYWKDFLPQLISKVYNLKDVLNVGGISMSGLEYRSAIIKNITLFTWRLEILTPLAAMFKDIEMSKEEREHILSKLCENLFELEPTALPGLALQLFGLCNTPSMIVIPILFFQKYFNKNYYTKEYDNVDSNTTAYDSIDLQSTNPREMQQVQETILYHLGNSTEFKLNEKDVVSVFRNIANTPHYILTPFMISALLTLSKVNRQPDVVRLSTSAILPFLRKVVQINENEKEMSQHSMWCRQTFNRNTVSIENIIAILIDQSITGMEVVTPGVVALAFTLLKAKKQGDLNLLGMNFLQKFLKKRYIFGQGILKQLSELMYANQDAPQFAECLNMLSLTNSLTISECVTTVQSILDFLLVIPGHHAMRMISFIYPLLKLSVGIRDCLISNLTKAMSSTDAHRRRFGVYSFCLLLKNLRNNTARRAVGGNMTSCSNLSFTQANISGFSLMSQSTLGNKDNPQRHFDMLALEIVGLLRKCFNEAQETKEILYEGLTRAIEFNHKLTSHLLIFIDWHFRSYFEVANAELVVRFDRLVTEVDGDIVVWDNIGKLISFVGTCVMTCEEHQITHDNRIIIDLLNTILEKADKITVQSLGLENDMKSREIGQQLIFLLEGAMAYAAMASSASRNHTKRFEEIFVHHQAVIAETKALFVVEKKGGKKAKAKELASSTPNCSTANEQSGLVTTQMTINDTQRDVGPEELQYKLTNIWETSTLQKLLEWVFSDSGEAHLSDIRNDVSLKLYLLTISTQQIDSYRQMPDYRHVKHSRRMFSFLCDVAKFIFGPLQTLFDSEERNAMTTNLTVECFRQCLMTAEAVYKRKLEGFFNFAGNDGCLQHEQILVVIKVVHQLLEKSVDDNSICGSSGSGADYKKMQQNLLHCLEILYNLLPPEHQECAGVATWLYDFCLKNNVDGKHLDGIFKLLFTQRMKYFDGDFFCSIAIQLSKVFGTLSVLEGETAFELKALTEVTAEPATLHLCSLLKKDLEDVEGTILKVKSIAHKIKYLGEKGADDDHIQSLKTMERAICAHLIHVANAMLHLTNSKIPVGTPTDTLLRLLTQYYICLNNVAKHLISRHGIIPVVYGHIKFDKLVQISGKPLASRVYGLIDHIDKNLLKEVDSTTAAKTGAPEKNKRKLIKETRSVPKLIRWLETLHKYVLILSKKTTKDLSGYLHIGIVRDFRIRNLNIPGDNDDSEDEENAAHLISECDSDAESNSTGMEEGSGTATAKILKNVAKLRKKAAPQKPAPVRGKRSRSAVVIPDVTGILSAINGPKSPAKKRAHRSTKTN